MTMTLDALASEYRRLLLADNSPAGRAQLEQTFTLTTLGEAGMLLLQTRRAAQAAERALREMSLEGDASTGM